ncbi:MAG TPA: antibiotic biosynthesis monooxygenase [Betaproteobacteria bacterium]|nr:antibiotic biosynthesis monooxygenase [Betaproteobacteria bacterium]
MIIAIVKAKIISGKQEELRTIADKLQYEYAPQEEGCEQYESFIDGSTFITLERWKNQNVLDKHLKTKHVEEFVPQMRNCVEGGEFSVQFIKTTDVSFVTL